MEISYSEASRVVNALLGRHYLAHFAQVGVEKINKHDAPALFYTRVCQRAGVALAQLPELSQRPDIQELGLEVFRELSSDTRRQLTYYCPEADYDEESDNGRIVSRCEEADLHRQRQVRTQGRRRGCTW